MQGICLSFFCDKCQEDWQMVAMIQNHLNTPDKIKPFILVVLVIWVTCTTSYGSIHTIYMQDIANKSHKLYNWSCFHEHAIILLYICSTLSNQYGHACHPVLSIPSLYVPPSLAFFFLLFFFFPLLFSFSCFRFVTLLTLQCFLRLRVGQSLLYFLLHNSCIHWYLAWGLFLEVIGNCKVNLVVVELAWHWYIMVLGKLTDACFIEKIDATSWKPILDIFRCE